MGVNLEIIAHFPDGDVTISKFNNLEIKIPNRENFFLLGIQQTSLDSRQKHARTTILIVVVRQRKFTSPFAIHTNAYLRISQNG